MPDGVIEITVLYDEIPCTNYKALHPRRQQNYSLVYCRTVTGPSGIYVFPELSRLGTVILDSGSKLAQKHRQVAKLRFQPLEKIKDDEIVL
jgi:hypothetical protein